jgi:apolipoprotein D and lipocalin family protein
VIALDSQYQYALVSGPDRGYLWILSRTPTIPESVKQEYLSIARELGFPVEKLVWVNPITGNRHTYLQPTNELKIMS